MSLDPSRLRARAWQMRTKAAALADIGRSSPDGAIRDAYTVLVSEYDMMAAQLEQLAQDPLADPLA